MTVATSDPTSVITAAPSPGSPGPPLGPLGPPLGPGGSSGWEIRFRDGTVLADIASIASNKQLRRRLNRPASCSFRVPSYLVNDIQADGLPLICAGYRQISVTLDDGLFFHGIIWNVQDDGDEDMVYTQVTAWDPMMIWRSRAARDDVESYSGGAGNLSDPSFIARNQFGGPIMEEILTASEGTTDLSRIPTHAEGPLFIDLSASTFTGGGVDLTGAPTNWPMTIAEIATLLTNTGELDIVLTPIIEVVTDPDPSDGVLAQANMATLQTYTGNYGTDRTTTVHFDYATGDFNARLFRRTDDMDTVENKIRYYLGPRLDQQHWRSDVTADHPDIPVDLATASLFFAISSSRDQLGVFQQTSIYDNFGSGSGTAGSESSAYPLFIRQWLVESLLRVRPRRMVYITPVRDGEFGPGDLDIGDLVTINIGNKARVAESGAQRIYAYTIDIDDDGVEALGEFESSPDQDGI